jgi:hypothetical protein
MGRRAPICGCVWPRLRISSLYGGAGLPPQGRSRLVPLALPPGEGHPLNPRVQKRFALLSRRLSFWGTTPRPPVPASPTKQWVRLCRRGGRYGSAGKAGGSGLPAWRPTWVGRESRRVRLCPRGGRSGFADKAAGLGLPTWLDGCGCADRAVGSAPQTGAAELAGRAAGCGLVREPAGRLTRRQPVAWAPAWAAGVDVAAWGACGGAASRWGSVG